MSGRNPADFRKKLSRTNELPLLYAVLLFQFAAMLLIAFRGSAADAFSLRVCVLLPAGTLVGLEILKRLWPIDRASYILVAFLCSLSVILLRAVFVLPDRARDQAQFLGIGFAALLFGAFFIRRVRSWEKLSRVCIPLCLAVLALPFFFSNSSAKNWVRLGGVQCQPSELMKPVATVIFAAGFSTKRGVRGWWAYALFGAFACGILLLQRDLGAMFLYFALTLAMFYAGTGNGKVTLAILILAATGVALALYKIDWIAEKIPAFRYAAERVRLWKDPWASAYDGAYQIVQGLISIVSGGVFGSGLGLGSANRVSVVASDYIFAAVSEEFGIAFAICVLAVYLCLLLRWMSAAMNARQRFHALVAFGCAFEMIAQMLLIVCGNLHLIPLTGVTLPFVSEGGSSLTACLAQTGMVLGVSSINAQDEFDDLCRVNGGLWREPE